MQITIMADDGAAVGNEGKSILTLARGCGGIPPKDFDRIREWFCDELLKVQDEDMQMLYGLCRTLWRRNEVIREVERRARRQGGA